MASLNRVTLIGYLGEDPEMRAFPSGDQVANVTIATTDRWKDKQTGEMKEVIEWHRVVFNDRLAEVVGQCLRKGAQVYIDGSLRTCKWTDQAGAEKYTTEIRADQMQMLGSRQKAGSQATFIVYSFLRVLRERLIWGATPVGRADDFYFIDK